jgi:hypothetical protein
MNPAPAAPPARRRRRVALTALLAAVLAAAAFAGWLVFRHHDAERQLRAAVTEVEATDPRWRLEQIEADRAAVLDAENAAAVVRRIRAKLVRPGNADWQGREELLKSLSPNVRLTDGQYRTLIDQLEEVESAVGPALALARYPRGRHPITYAPDGYSTPLFHTDDIHTAQFRVLKPLALVLAHEGDAAGAIQACLATLNLGRSIGDEPFFMSQLVRSADAHEAVRGLERVLGQGEVPDAALAELQTALAAEVAHDPWRLNLHAQRAMAFQTLEAVRTGLLKPSTLRREHRGSAASWGRKPPPITTVEHLRDAISDRFTPDVRPAQAWLLRHYTRLIETAALPWPERRAAAEAVEAERADAPELARFDFGDPVEFAKPFQLAQARGRCAVAAVAAERYRRRHGAWPAVLAPECLPDPFDGQPLRYRRLADGVVIYSVGPDGADDGGRLSDDSSPPAGTDVGVRLWDVPHRRQPAEPEAPP